ncbi:hypothetical protein PHMEG_00039659 [Phytophthora megakarya]|uniref:Reverse transcriptase/retrotransposon-derived protein RNase H-like domain-containing protein n=1 Tax=Phytophthora megakarya TaxID=4795 RepID=A0A225UGG9_9STRA|nr:hypothetical protein PHMEG_00039659 [Phytophthora megakarya]
MYCGNGVKRKNLHLRGLKVVTQPLLLYQNFELPFRLVTDASKVRLGACLQQDRLTTDCFCK